MPDSDIEAALTGEGPPQIFHRDRCYAGLDLGLVRDATALVIVARSHQQFTPPEIEELLAGQPDLVEADVAHLRKPLRIVATEVWRPSRGERVDLEVVERHILALYRKYRFRLSVDTWQAIYLCERLERQGVPIQEVSFTPQNLVEMCHTLLDCFAQQKIAIYRDKNLLHDLRGLKVLEKSYGLRLDSDRGPSGHGDCATALSLALLGAKQFKPAQFTTVQPTRFCFPLRGQDL